MQLARFTLLSLLITASTAQVWEGPYEMPIVPVAAANLPDGRILAWAAALKDDFKNGKGKTAVSIFDPKTKKSTDRSVQDTNHDMFCPGTSVLGDGRVMITGGRDAKTTTFYLPDSDKWVRGDDMNIARGYQTNTVLGNGDVFILGGSWSGGVGGKHGELWSEDKGWEKLDKITLEGSSSFLTNDAEGVYRSDNHMWLFTAPNGKIFHAGPSQRMHWIDPTDQGRVTDSKYRSPDAMNGNAVMFDIGKILTLGGALNYRSGSAHKSAYVIDLNGGEGDETVTRVGDMVFARSLQSAVALPSGEVVVTGGQSKVKLFSDDFAVYTAEIWNPSTGRFTALNNMKVPRTYHSVGILMQDGRVWVGGGGLCGDRCPTANHFDAEIFTPPYLTNADGSLKTRPVIESANSNAGPGDTITVTMNTSGAHTFALMRASAVTHTVNTDQRRIPLVVKNQSNQSFTMTLPSSYNVLLPGMYFLFAMNSAGVPSVATTIYVAAGQTVSPPGPVPVPVTAPVPVPVKVPAPVPVPVPVPAPVPVPVPECGKMDYKDQCRRTRQCKGMYPDAYDCDRKGGHVCLCRSGSVCGCIHGY